MRRRIFKAIASLLVKWDLYITKSLVYSKRPRQLDLVRGDFVRYATLELVRQEIQAKGLKGNVAEVGVYQGDFAAQVNRCFPDKTFYLFDTFEGFEAGDVAVDQSEGYSTGQQDFSKTSVDLVLSKMVDPSACVVCKGHFPESAAGLENERFSFVSLDADLYQPIYQGLCFFYPRLEVGGYIFVHDVNNDEYVGARKAVERYCRANGVAYVPIPDVSGTVVIAK